MKPKLVTPFREITTLIYISNKEIRLSLFLTVVKRFFLGKLFEIKKGTINFQVTAIGKKRITQSEIKTY